MPPLNTHRKGSRWRLSVQQWLAAHGIESTYRPLGSAGDDLTTYGRRPLSIECKNVARFDLAGWIDQAESQPRGSGTIPLVLLKRRGRTDPADGYAIMRAARLLELLEDR